MTSYPFTKSFQQSVTRYVEYEFTCERQGKIYALTAASNVRTYRVWALDEETGLERLYEKCRLGSINPDLVLEENLEFELAGNLERDASGKMVLMVDNCEAVSGDELMELLGSFAGTEFKLQVG